MTSPLGTVPGPDGEPVPVILRRLRAARRMRLRVDVKGNVVVTAPLRCPVDSARAFVEGNRTWLAGQLGRRAAVPTLLEHLSRQPTLSGLGHAYALEFRETIGRPYLLRDDLRRGVLFALPPCPGDAAVAALCREFAAAVIPLRVRELAQRTASLVKRVSVRNQASRWGSCSSRGTLSLNWRLVLLTAALHDHVILHELAHLHELNHSADFWGLLASWDVDTDAHKQALNPLARTLMPFGR